MTHRGFLDILDEASLETPDDGLDRTCAAIVLSATGQRNEKQARYQKLAHEISPGKPAALFSHLIISAPQINVGDDCLPVHGPAQGFFDTTLSPERDFILIIRAGTR